MTRRSCRSLIHTPMFAILRFHDVDFGSAVALRELLMEGGEVRLELTEKGIYHHPESEFKEEPV